jgi:iron-sulfur cluster assembly protein
MSELKIINITDSAANEVRRLLTEKESNGETSLGLRLGIKGGGCSGLSYHLDFDKKADGDTVINEDGFEVYMDRKSTIYLRGIELDHESGLTGKGFVFKNPNATNTCGCGESFSI